MYYDTMYYTIMFPPIIKYKYQNKLRRICYVKARLKVSSVMRLQNEKLVVDEFLEKVAAASRKVCCHPTLPFHAFLLPFAFGP